MNTADVRFGHVSVEVAVSSGSAAAADVLIRARPCTATSYASCSSGAAVSLLDSRPLMKDKIPATMSIPNDT